MKESYIEGLASHGGPESCAGVRKDAGEALTGVHMGGVLSRDNHRQQGADVVASSGRQNAYARQGECIGNPARSKTSGTYGNSMRENREIPCPPLKVEQKDVVGRSMTAIQQRTGRGSRTIQ